MLTVGIPKEIKELEKRVGLTPDAVRVLCEAKIPVYVERGAGAGSGYSDEDYRRAGAKLADNARGLYEAADFIEKVKEPLPQEYALMKSRQIIFGYFHLAAPENCGLLDTLLAKQVTSIAYETLEKEGRLPLLAPMSEIAGGLAGYYGFYLIEEFLKPKKKDFYRICNLLETIAAKYPNVPFFSFSFHATIFGAGIAGMKAAETLKKCGAQVLLVEKNEQKAAELAKSGWQVVAPEKLNLPALEKTDILIGSVHMRGQRAVKVLDDETFAKVSKSHPKVVIDISIDQGGNFPDARVTSYSDPVYEDEYGNLRFSVPNIPSFAGRFASEQLSRLSLPYTLALAQNYEAALKNYPELRAALNTEKGEIKLAAIQEAHKR